MINVSKLLKGCNKGTSLYSKLHGSVQFMGFTDVGNIRVKGQCGSNCYNQFGQPIGYPDSECMLFPNKDCTWDGWKAPVEPKFKVGDWIIDINPKYNSNIFYVSKVLENTYELIDIDGDDYHNPHYNIDEHFCLWTINDAEDGDVLACHEDIVIFREIDGLNIKTHLSYHYLYNPGIYTNCLHNKKAFRPATKEERDLLFAKMAEDDYSWDDEKKVLISYTPRFSVGEWISNSAVTHRIHEIKGGDYHFVGGLVLPCKNVDKCFHRWTVEDAVDGDVIVTKNNNIFIFHKIEGTVIKDYCGLYFDKFCHIASSPNGIMEPASECAYVPATKKQGDLLFSKMEECGFSWDSEKKKLIVNFKAGMPVLVRDVDNQTWGLSQFSHRDMGCYICLNREDFVQCIPFEGNEHLIGTTDECDEVYITWRN